MWPSSYDMLANIVGAFSVNSTQSELPSLSPELTADVTSLSKSEGSLGVAFVRYVGRARFGYFLLLLMDAGVVVLGAAELVSVWATRATPEQDGKAGHPAPLVMMVGDNAGSSR